MYAGILPSLMDRKAPAPNAHPRARWTLINSRSRGAAARRVKAKARKQITRTATWDIINSYRPWPGCYCATMRNSTASRRTRPCSARSPTSPCSRRLPHLYQISAEWKKRMESSQKPSMSLRVTLFQALLLELKSRLQKIVGSEENKAVLRRQGYLSPTNDWLFLRWEPGTESLKPAPDRSMSHSRLMEHLKICGRQPSAIPGQSAAGRGTDGPSADVYYGARLEEPRPTKLYRAMLDIQGVAALQTVALRIHTPRMQQSKLAEQVASLIRRGSSGSSW